MYGIIIGLSLISFTVSQYQSRGGLRADVVFDEDNERFDVNAIKAAMAHKYNRLEAIGLNGRRNLENDLVKNIAKRIRNYHAEIENLTDVVPLRRYNNPVPRSIYENMNKIDNKYNSNNKNPQVVDKLLNRLVEVASNSLKGQDLDNNVENQGNTSRGANDVKNDYRKKLKKSGQDEVTANRKASQIVNELHQGIRRFGDDEVIGNPVEDLLMHYAFPMKVKLQGFVNVPKLTKN